MFLTLYHNFWCTAPPTVITNVRSLPLSVGLMQSLVAKRFHMNTFHSVKTNLQCFVILHTIVLYADIIASTCCHTEKNPMSMECSPYHQL